ncbi:GNAT family N-acetyltransferase, partial [Arthrobacter sp.]|uniref:GNAT family N-acetyltransferase n=1 Tax=Arthrobacter sp. TaxID=1667 RepID=UPI0026E02083
MSEPAVAQMPAVLQGNICIRPLSTHDAGPLATAYARNRAYLQPWEPVRPDEFYAESGQRAAVAGALHEDAAGRSVHWLLADADRVVGRISLTDIVHGAFLNGHVGYWVDEDFQRRGLATEALAHVCHVAAQQGLH